MNDKKFVSWEAAVTWLIDQPEQQELVKQCYFDRPVIDAVKRYQADPEWQELSKSWIPKTPGKAFDLGAGNGIVSYALAKEGWHVTALEPDPSAYVGAEAIRQFAQSENLNIDVLQEWGEAIPCSDDEFDLIMARQVIHHANDLQQMYQEIARILKPGGKLIAFRDHVIDSDEGLVEFQNNHPLHNLYGGENAFTLEQYIGAIEKAGLRIERTLHQFDSVINYAPRTQRDIFRAMAGPLKISPAIGAASTVMSIPPLSSMMLNIANRINKKQGRLVSFVCTKPA